MPCGASPQASLKICFSTIAGRLFFYEKIVFTSCKTRKTDYIKATRYSVRSEKVQQYIVVSSLKE